MPLHQHYYAEQESTENRCLESSKIQTSIKFTCVKRGCILLYHCILNTKQLVVKNKSNISENTDASSFYDSSQIYVVCIPFHLSEATLLLDFVFLDSREDIKFLSWHNWLITLLPFHVHVTKPGVPPTACILQKCIFMCLCQCCISCYTAYKQ